jgi:hypothetical protein
MPLEERGEERGFPKALMSRISMPVLCGDSEVTRACRMITVPLIIPGAHGQCDPLPTKLCQQVFFQLESQQAQYPVGDPKLCTDSKKRPLCIGGRIHSKILGQPLSATGTTVMVRTNCQFTNRKHSMMIYNSVAKTHSFPVYTA